MGIQELYAIGLDHSWNFSKTLKDWAWFWRQSHEKFNSRWQPFLQRFLWEKRNMVLS